MKQHEIFGLTGAVFIAPHVEKLFGLLLAFVYLGLAIVFMIQDKK